MRAGELILTLSCPDRRGIVYAVARAIADGGGNILDSQQFGDPDDGVVTIPVLLARFGQTAAVPLMREALVSPQITVATVCGGSLALAMAGLLEGRNAATHHLGMDVLEATGVNVVHARVVDDGDLVTSGAVTSGLDLALYLLERGYGPRVEIAVESLFGYERRGTVWTNTGRAPVPV